jgi:hypothetical protein
VTQKKRKPGSKPAPSSSRPPSARTASARPAGGAKAGGANQSAAQKRLAAQRAMAAASGARAARRKRLLTYVVAPVVAVIVIVVIIVVVGTSSTSGSKVDHTPVAAPASLTTAITTIPESVFDAVGTGSGVQPPAAGTGTALTAGGLPRILYVGAEWCPYCAAERWAVTAALARFGTFTGLQTTYSKSDDVDPNTPTLSFAKAKYSSPLISASLDEIQDSNGNTVLTLPAADSTLFTGKGTGEGGGSFPYVNIGGKNTISGASYDPGLLKGKTYAEIAAAMADPTSAIGKAIDGTANYITASICSSMSSSTAPAVCASTGVSTAAKALGVTLPTPAASASSSSASGT